MTLKKQNYVYINPNILNISIQSLYDTISILSGSPYNTSMEDGTRINHYEKDQELETGEIMEWTEEGE